MIQRGIWDYLFEQNSRLLLDSFESFSLNVLFSSVISEPYNMFKVINGWI